VSRAVMLVLLLLRCVCRRRPHPSRKQHEASWAHCPESDKRQVSSAADHPGPSALYQCRWQPGRLHRTGVAIPLSMVIRRRQDDTQYSCSLHWPFVCAAPNKTSIF